MHAGGEGGECVCLLLPFNNPKVRPGVRDRGKGVAGGVCTKRGGGGGGVSACLPTASIQQPEGETGGS